MTEQRAELEKLARAARPVPYSMVESGSPEYKNQCWYVEANPPGVHPLIAEVWSDADAAYIVAACNAVPDLLATIARLEAERVKDGEALEFYANGWEWFPGDGEAPDATHPGSPPTFYEADPTSGLKEDAGEIARARLSSRAKDQSQ